MMTCQWCKRRAKKDLVWCGHCSGPRGEAAPIGSVGRSKPTAAQLAAELILALG